MKDLHTYGFSYEHDGRVRHLDIRASSQEDAESLLDSMTRATFVGKLRESGLKLAN